MASVRERHNNAFYLCECALKLSARETTVDFLHEALHQIAEEHGHLDIRRKPSDRRGGGMEVASHGSSTSGCSSTEDPATSFCHVHSSVALSASRLRAAACDCRKAWAWPARVLIRVE